MTTQTNIPVSDDPLDDINSLGNVGTRVRGLLYLLAARASDNASDYNSPNIEEGMGITWLANLVGEQLTDAINAVQKAPLGNGKWEGSKK